MTISAKIILDSISPQGIRLTTMELRYPKFIHGELMTHRVFSRNASSSRAIPFSKLLADISADPALPVSWGSNKPGMQAGAELDADTICYVKQQWLDALHDAVYHARKLHEMGLHKQVVNRILEPWCHIKVIVTSTHWTNFFALRCHPDAQPEMRVLAQCMKNVYDSSTPYPLQPGQWHLPYVNVTDGNGNPEFASGTALQNAIRISVARCASISYQTVDGKEMTVERACELHNKLVGSHPMHATPAEHQATPDEPEIDPYAGWQRPHLHGNFTGWIQYRKTLPGECQ